MIDLAEDYLVDPKDELCREKRHQKKVAWKDNEGYFIISSETAEQFFALLDGDERQAVDDFVRQSGNFNATDLSLVATALYLKDNFGVEESRLSEAVHNAKKNTALITSRKY